MRKFVDYMVGPRGKRFRTWPGLLANMSVLGAMYYMVGNLAPGHISYYMILLPCLIILLTSIARVNDMGAKDHDWTWHVRKLGFIVSGTAAVAYMTIPLASAARWPTWNGVFLAWGVAAAWLTTPNMIPWWRYITGEFRKKDLEKLAEGDKTDVLTK